jgi:hypothetical protein
VRYSIAIKHVAAGALAAMLLCGAVAFAQAPQPGSTTPAAAPKPLTPLKLVVTVSRVDGAKTVASVPYTLWVNSNDKESTQLNFGLRIPTPQATVGGDGGTSKSVSYSYQNAGTNITTSATTLDDGRFRVLLVISDSSLVPSKDAAQNSGLPTFMSFSTTNYLLLRDGQTAQFVAATDKVSGEVTKIDVTINVLK